MHAAQRIVLIAAAILLTAMLLYLPRQSTTVEIVGAPIPGFSLRETEYKRLPSGYVPIWSDDPRQRIDVTLLSSQVVITLVVTALLYLALQKGRSN